MADFLTITNAQGAVHLSDSTQQDRSSEGYFLDCYKTLMAACEPHDSVGAQRLMQQLNAANDVQDFFREISPNDSSLFVQVMKAFNQRTTGFPVEYVTKQYAQAGYTLTDSNDQHQSVKSYSVSFENGQAKVSQKFSILYDHEDPTEIKGAFDMTFTTTIDIESKKVSAVSTDIVPLSKTFIRDQHLGV